MPRESGGKKFGTRDAAALCRIDVTTLRRLERQGVLCPERSSTGIRQYTLDDVERVCRHYRRRKSSVRP